MKDKSIVLLSGGLDSTLCLSLAVKAAGPQNVVALSLRYGQKHEKEVKAASRVAFYEGVKHIEYEMPPIFVGGDSTLMKGGPDNPQSSYEDIEETYGVSPTYVPFRNGNLLSVATALAMKEDAKWLYYGAHEEDARNWAYPDCTPEFNGAMANAIFVGTYNRVRLVVPLQNMTKVQIVNRLRELKAPIHLTWSCYEGHKDQCGKCPTCVARIRAFKAAKFKDPVPYAINIDWSDCDGYYHHS